MAHSQINLILEQHIMGNKKRLKHSSIEWIESKGILGSNWSQIPELLETIGLAYAISLLISIKPRLDC